MAFFKRFLCALTIVLFSVVIKAQTIEVEGDVTGVWSYDTVKVTGNINLPAGASLFIEPGVVVEFQGFYRFTVDGSLQAIGLPGTPIVFTVNDTTGLHDMYAPSGGWAGISLAGGEENNAMGLFDHCHFEFAKTWEGDSLLHGGAVRLTGAVTASFQHCSFFHNRSFLSGAGIYANGASPLVENCQFVGNQAGHLPVIEESYGYGGGICGINTKGQFRHNVFFDNWSTGLGGGMSFDISDPVIENNIFEGNDSPLGGGLGILRSHVTGTIANNLVLNNHSVFFGGGMALITTQASLSNNTITGNYAAYGGGLFFNFEAFVKVYNTVIWGNSANGEYGYSVYIWDGPSVPDFYYCNIEGGQENFDGATFLGEYLHNIDLDPLFAEEGEHPWQLSPQSPAINSGTEDPSFLSLPETDLAGNARIQLGRIDMGAYESDTWAFTGTSTSEADELALRVSPNPARTQAAVHFTTSRGGAARIFVVNARGQQKHLVFDGHLPPGQHDFRLPDAASRLGKGVFFVIAESNQQRVSEKWIVIN